MNNRRRGAYILMILSAFSMVAMYALQGVFASGHSTDNLPSWFWRIDWALWAARAVIEAVVILYLFETEAEKTRDKRLLAFFEVSLIALITATIAPAIRAQGLGLSMSDSVSSLVYTLWCVGVAAYTPLMMGGLATALRVQPGNNFKLENAKLRKDLADLVQSQAQADQSNQILALLRHPDTVKSASALARVLFEHVYTNGNTPETPVVAKMLDVSNQNISRVKREVQSVES